MDMRYIDTLFLSEKEHVVLYVAKPVLLLFMVEGLLSVVSALTFKISEFSPHSEFMDFVQEC
jgi:hypothetical protein